MVFVKSNYAEGANDFIADLKLKFQNVVKTYDEPLNCFKKSFLSTESMSYFDKF